MRSATPIVNPPLSHSLSTTSTRHAGANPVAVLQNNPANNRTELTAGRRRAAMRIAVYEAFPAQIYATLTGGVFLPAFALALGANNFYIGVLAAIPFFANLFQLAGAYFVENYPGRKKLCVAASALPRLAWAPAIILFLLLAPQSAGVTLGILLAFLILAHALLAVSGVSWLSWMTDVVPENIRGRYFGLRNSIVSIATVITTFAGGWFLDWHRGSRAAFGILFLTASAAGAVCTILLIKQPEPPKKLLPKSERFFQHYFEPFKQPNFRRLLRFSIIWQFAFNLASPFFVVYMLTELGMSYSMAATFAVITALFDLIGMRVWGHVSDHIGNKPVITISAVAVTILPWLWLFTEKNDLSFYGLIPVLHIAGGFFWAGYNLCSVNILFRLSPQSRNSVYFGAWAACNGLAAGISSLLGGTLGRWAAHHQMDFVLFSWSGLKIVFFVTGALRLIAIFLLRPIQEPAGMRTLHAIRVLRSVKSRALMMDDHPALQFFIPEQNSPEDSPKNDDAMLWPIFGRRRKKAA
ncbi:MAG: MFS transporter [candidate division KSB1 bacterium]|nr:MFS transporter [candidate division KSB1 bacterium]MDZ7365568.1 MFS transporter [candidate division KSB1 bacterium]MDZ7403670.1 MFS transporter [candidate division KSB1 bacterium]